VIEGLDLSQFGMAGLFIGYLIYDKQVVTKKIIKGLEAIERKINGKK
jgi:hypothetical protein